MRTKTLIGATLLILSSRVIAQPFFLSCDLQVVGGSPMSMDFKIDEEKKTVRDYPATFTETSISYDMPMSAGGTLTTVFSRLTGQVIVWDKEGDKTRIFARGTCVVNKTQKF